MNHSVTEIKELQKCIFHIYIEIDKICKNNNWTLFLIGGSAIGAIRHHGFIPWDDDMDLAMPREQYESFIQVAKKTLPDYLKLYWKKRGQYYVLMDTRYNVKYKEEVKDVMLEDNNHSHPFVDIQPLDGTPNIKILRTIHCMRVMYYRMCFKLSDPERIHVASWRPMWENILIRCLQPFSLLFRNEQKILKKYTETMTKYDFDNSDYIANFVGRYHLKDVYPKSWWIPGIKVTFENIDCMIPRDYDKYLTQLYGDYMIIPDKKNQESHLSI